MADEAVIDAPEVELGAETPEIEVVEPEIEGSTVQSDGEEQSGANLWKTIKETLKTSDPKTAAAVRNAIFKQDQLSKRFPQGLGAIDKQLEAIKQLSDDKENPDAVPFDQVIQNTLSERTFWRDFDNKFQGGDAALIGQLVEANAESFQKLVPAALDKFAELNPDGYASIISNVAVNYLDANKVPFQFEMLDMLLPKSSDDPGTQRIIAAIANIRQAVDNLRGMAAKPVVPVGGTNKEEPAPAVDADRELRVKDVEWNRDIAGSTNELMASEALKVAGKNKFTPQEIETVKAKVKEEINARVAINSTYQKSLQSYLRNNNRPAYKQLVSSEHKKIITGGAVRRAVDDVLAARKGKPAVAAKPVAAKTALPSEPGQIKFEMIAGSPASQGLKVDHGRSTHQMQAGKDGFASAYVVGRSNPVRWKIRK